MIRCILFDRDGTLGELDDNRYPQTIQPFCDIKSVFTRLKEKGYIVGIITNQSSIARGTAKDYDFNAEFISYNTDIWEICPHDDIDCCNCRKPKSGLLLNIVNRLNISPSECLVIGDRITDLECALNIGAQAALTLTGFGKQYLSLVKKIQPSVLILNRFDDILNHV